MEKPMFGITLPAINSAARTLAGYAAVWLVAKGFLTDGAESELFITGVVTIVGLAASMYFRRKTALVKQAANLPEVKTITVTDPQIVDAAPANVKPA
jgi:hypothetical protein